MRGRSPSPNPSMSTRNGSVASVANQPQASNNSSAAVSSMPQAAYIYSAKLTPPSSVAAVAAKEQSKRPASARNVAQFSSSIILLHNCIVISSDLNLIFFRHDIVNQPTDDWQTSVRSRKFISW